MKQILLLLLCSYSLTAVSQDRVVSGRVTSSTDGVPIPGVNVIIKGTTIGTATNVDGRYSIAIDQQAAVLVFSFIGFATREVPVESEQIINVVLEEDATLLSEVVVVGYGEQERRTLTSAISKIAGADIAQKPVSSFDQALVGKASGVMVTVPSGLVGQAPRIRIRGTNSITSGANPLIIVDGVPMVNDNPTSATGVLSAVAPSNFLGDINPNDIESYEVLKDGAATAIYGSRAANGVILITTKSGRASKPKVTYDFQYGTNTVAKKFDVLNAEEFIQINNEKFATSGLITPQALPGPDNADTDWQEQIFRSGKFQSHNLGITGGNESLGYFFSAGYMDQEGAIVNNSMERFNVRANVDYHGVDWFSAGVKSAIARQVINGLVTGTNALSGNVTNALRAFPNVPVFSADHPTGYNISDPPANTSLGRGNNLQNIASNYPNIKYILDNNKQEADNYRLLNSAYLQGNILEGLTVRTQIGTDVTDAEDFLRWNPHHGDGGGSTRGIVIRQSTRILRWNWQNTLNLKRTLAEQHHIGLTVGNEFQKTTTRTFSAQGTTFSDPSFLKYDLISGTFATQESGGDYIESGFDSYFGRFNYDYKEKYLLSFSARNDAISSLPKENRQGTFYGGSVGWIVSGESFFSVPFISQLKIRASLAEVGNTDIGSFPYVGTYGPELYGNQSGIVYSNVGNAALRWETSKKLDLGLDFGLWDDRINGSVDYFQNRIDDMILDAPTSPTAGLPGNNISKNIGSMINEGIELTLASENLTGAVQWRTNLTFTYATNEIVSLNNDDDIIFTYTINRVGEPISALYGYEYAGVNPANGNPMYIKGDGTLVQGNPLDNTYYLVNTEDMSDLSQPTTPLSASADRKVLGNTAPKFFGGIGNTFSFRNLDLDVFLTYGVGNKIMNVTRQAGMAQEFLNNSKEILNRWTPENPNTEVPRLSYANSSFLNLDNNGSSRFVEDGSFLRVQNVSLGYTIPESILSKFAAGTISKVRLFAQVRNAFVFTKYSGVDPELNFSTTTNSQFGVDFNTNPQLRTFTAGLTLGF